MKFKKLEEPVFTCDLYYDLIVGGYINPFKLLESPIEAAEVQKAIALLDNFVDDAVEAGVLDIQ